MPAELFQYGPWIILAWLLIKEVVPLLLPQITKAYNKRITTEDRLFEILKESNAIHKECALVLLKLSQGLDLLTERVYHLDEQVQRLNDKS